MSDFPDIIYHHNKTYGDETYHHDRVLRAKDAEIARYKEAWLTMRAAADQRAEENTRLREAVKVMREGLAFCGNVLAAENIDVGDVIDKALSAADEILGGKG